MDIVNEVYARLMAFSIPQKIGLVTGTYALYWVTRYLNWRWNESRKPFNIFTTNEDAIDEMDLGGQLAIVTGCNIGIGKETVRVLAKQGCTVIMACRNAEKASIARDEILKDLNLDGDITSERLQVLPLDLSSLKSIREFADNWNKTNRKINYLINNAGIMALPKYSESKDGYEMQFATNHLGHYYLTLLLMPSILKKEESNGSGRLPRIINLSSTGHRLPKDYDWTLNLFNDCIESKDFMGDNHKSEYDPWLNYGISKSSNILFTRELQKRYNNELITVAVHPGAVSTGLGRYLDAKAIFAMLKRSFSDPHFLYRNMKPLNCGAATTLRCVSLDDNEINPGHYYANCNDANDLLESVPKRALKDEGIICAKLWELSQVLIENKGFSLTS